MLRRFPRVRVREQTADVVREAAMSLLAALREVDFPTTRDFFALAAEHVRRRLVHLARRHSRRGGGHLPLDEVAHEAPDGADEGLARWQELHEAVPSLPAEQREVFSLRFYHGWEHRDIAELLQVSTKQSQRLWLRAQVRLGELLGGRGLPQ